MLRLSICSVTALAILVGGALAADQNKATNDKNTEANKAANDRSADHARDKTNQGEKATITKVNPKEGTVTLRMKDENGKDVTRTFHLTEDVRVIDDNTGRVAGLDVFQSGDDVLVVESKGRLQEMHRHPAHENKGTENNKDNRRDNSKSGRK